MSGSTPTFARRAPGLLSRIVSDRRRHKRVAVELLGRFMRENKQEHACKLIDISAGGAAIKPLSPVPVTLGERVVAFFEHVGGIEGSVTRSLEGGFAIKLASSGSFARIGAAIRLNTSSENGSRQTSTPT